MEMQNSCHVDNRIKNNDIGEVYQDLGGYDWRIWHIVGERGGFDLALNRAETAPPFGWGQSKGLTLTPAVPAAGGQGGKTP